MQDHVDALRRFNRSFTQRIGVLDDSFLGSGRPLGPSRLLYEIGPHGIGVQELRTRLGLDSGYVSRLLRQLESEGLVAVVTDQDDGRRRAARLTESGLEERRVLERRSEELARRMIAPLSPNHQVELSAALVRADRLLRAATTTFDVVDPASEQAVWAIGQYFEELDRRFPTGFDPGDSLIVDAPSMRSPTGTFVVAHSDGGAVACGGVKSLDETTGEIKRMWVHPEMRGAGIGRRMLEHLEQRAEQLGHTQVVLDTNSTLLEAIAMYERAGYASIERYNDNPYARRWFAKALG